MNVSMNTAIILSGGTGCRIGTKIPKQFLKIGGKTIIEHTIDVFEDHNDINEIIIVSNKDYLQKTEEILNKNNYKKIKKIIEGGDTRQESSLNGVLFTDNDIKNLLIHDAARPFVTAKLIDKLLRALSKNKAVIPAISSTDTLIEKDNKNMIKHFPDRNVIQRVQTPQAFDYSTIKKAHTLAKEEGYINATDDCSLVLKYKLSDVFVIEGSIDNIKITYPSDVIYAEELLRNKEI